MKSGHQLLPECSDLTAAVSAEQAAAMAALYTSYYQQQQNTTTSAQQYNYLPLLTRAAGHQQAGHDTPENLTPLLLPYDAPSSGHHDWNVFHNETVSSGSSPNKNISMTSETERSSVQQRNDVILSPPISSLNASLCGAVLPSEDLLTYASGTVVAACSSGDVNDTASLLNSSGQSSSSKSTKGASKLRRDMINCEIGRLRELLPLPHSTRQRLSQLQLMALVCVYVRKTNFFQQVKLGQQQQVPPVSTFEEDTMLYNKNWNHYKSHLSNNHRRNNCWSPSETVSDGSSPSSISCGDIPSHLRYTSTKTSSRLYGDVKSTVDDNSSGYSFTKAMDGFILLTTQSGKLLYISDNAADFLGHSMEDLLIHGDSLYDIIDKNDHKTLSSELLVKRKNKDTTSSTSSNETPSVSDAKNLLNDFNEKINSSCWENNKNETKGNVFNGIERNSDMNRSDNIESEKRRIALCRLNVSRNARRPMRFGDQKMVLIEGRYCGRVPFCSRYEDVFVGWCTPIVMPETRESVFLGSTNVFITNHSLDFKFKNVDYIAEYFFDQSGHRFECQSWYNYIHPDDLIIAQSKHRYLLHPETKDRSCVALIRYIKNSNEWFWAHVVLQVKSSTGSPSSNNHTSSSSSVHYSTGPMLSSKMNNNSSNSTTSNVKSPKIVSVNSLVSTSGSSHRLHSTNANFSNDMTEGEQVGNNNGIAAAATLSTHDIHGEEELDDDDDDQNILHAVPLNPDTSYIVCTTQVLSDHEAEVMQSNAWFYTNTNNSTEDSLDTASNKAPSAERNHEFLNNIFDESSYRSGGSTSPRRSTIVASSIKGINKSKQTQQGTTFVLGQQHHERMAATPNQSGDDIDVQKDLFSSSIITDFYNNDCGMNVSHAFQHSHLQQQHASPPETADLSARSCRPPVPAVVHKPTPTPSSSSVVFQIGQSSVDMSKCCSSDNSTTVFIDNKFSSSDQNNNQM